MDGVPVELSSTSLDPSSRAPTVTVRSWPGHPRGWPAPPPLARHEPPALDGSPPGVVRPSPARSASYWVTTTAGAAVRLSTMPSSGVGRRGGAARCRPPGRPQAEEGDGQETGRAPTISATDLRPSGWGDGVTLGQPTKGWLLRRGGIGRLVPVTSAARRWQGSKVGVGGTARKVGLEVRGRGFYRARARNPTQPNPTQPNTRSHEGLWSTAPASGQVAGTAARSLVT